MGKETLEKLLTNACELLTQLEHFANSEQLKKIDALFDEINYSDELDAELDAINPNKHIY